MSESTVETTTSGVSLESILWAAAERWSDEPGLVDRAEFADYIFDAWGADSPSEEFVSRFFDGDPTIARPSDMAEAVSRASRSRMHTYNFDLNRLEYVVIEDAEQVVLVSDDGQFALPNDDYVLRAIERAIIPGTKEPLNSSGPYSRKQDGTPRAYFVRRSGEIFAIDVEQLSKTVQQAQRDLKPVFAPVLEQVNDRLMPFNPTRTAMMPNREVELLRKEPRISTWIAPPPRKRLVSGPVSALGAGLDAPANADTAVLLLLPDGTLARPVIGSGSRWRDMVSDWTARAAMISVDASARPDAVMDERRYAIQTDRVVAIFSGVRTSAESDDAPGELGFTSQTRGEAIAAARMLQANIRVLGDDDLAQAVLGGAQLVSGLAAPIIADARTGTGFWLQPEIYFQPSSSDRDYASREVSLRSDGYSNAALENQLAAPQQEFVSAQGATSDISSGATSDPWSNWALQAGGQLDPAVASTALRNRDVEGGSVSVPTDPSALTRFARRDREIGAGVDAASSSAAFSALGEGAPIRMPSERVIAFRAPDGALVFQPQANTQVRLASVHRSVGDADDLPSGAVAFAPSPRRFSASIGTRSGALPATALAALATALNRTAAASGYKLPRVLSLDSAEDAIPVGRAISSSLSEYAPQRSRAMLTETPQLTGSVGRMVLSLPFPSAGEVVVGADLDEALQAWMVAPAVSVGDTASAFASGGYSQVSTPGASFMGGAVGGAVAGGLALQSFGSSGYSAPALSNAELVSSGNGGSFESLSSDGVSGGAASGGSVSGLDAAALTVPSLSGPGFVVAAAGATQTVFSDSPIDLAAQHGSARALADRALFALQIPGAADSLASRAALARLPRLLSRALGASGSWMPGAGTPLPQPVRDFALSGPFDLPELAAIGPIPERDAGAPVPTRVLNPGEEEIEIPMPLWTQMGRGRLSSTDAIMASPRMPPGLAPPLGVYRLVSPEPVDFTAGAPESTPGIVNLQGPTELGLQRSLAGGVEANQLGGRFILGRIPLADGETAVTSSGRMRVGAPVFGGDAALISGAGGDAVARAPYFAGGANLLGGEAPSGALVSSSSGGLQVAAQPSMQMPEVPDFDTPAIAPSSSGRPFASALRSALKMSDDVGGRTMPADSAMSSSAPSSSPSFFSGGRMQGFSGAGPSGFNGTSGVVGGTNSLLSSAPQGGLVAGGTSSLVSGSSQGGLVAGGTSSLVSGSSQSGLVTGGTSSLVSEAPQGSFVSGGISPSVVAPSAAVASGAGAIGSSASNFANGSSSTTGSIGGLRAGAWSGSSRAEGGYTPWVYGSRFSPSEQSHGGVDLFSGSRLNRPNYPTLPAMLRFRYIGAPLWWSATTGSWAAGASSDNTSDVGGSQLGRSLRSGLSAANSAANIWRSIFVSPGRQGPGGTSGSDGASASDAGAIDQTWDRSADSMASLSSRMALIAVGVGGGAAAAADGAAASSSAGPETVYVAMDSAGRAGTTTGGAKSLSPSELSMRIVAAIPPSPPPLADMAAASSTNVEARPRHVRAPGHHGHGDEQKGEEGMSRAKIEGSVDAIAQRIYHRIVRRLEADRERFGG